MEDLEIVEEGVKIYKAISPRALVYFDRSTFEELRRIKKDIEKKKLIGENG